MNKACKQLRAARKMPPKYHRYPGTEFDEAESEVINWLCRQPEIRSYLYNRCTDAGLIVFDPETRMWHGADYFAEETEQKEDTGAKCEW